VLEFDERVIAVKQRLEDPDAFARRKEARYEGGADVAGSARHQYRIAGRTDGTHEISLRLFET
jgi:hypothetical protein